MALKISPEQWEDYKPKILQLYMNKNLTLDVVMILMKKQGFNATKSQYTTKLKAWNFLKNANQLPAQVWRHIDDEKRKRKRDNRGDDIEVIIDGVVQPPAKVRKETSRHFFTTRDELDGNTSPPRGILVSVGSPDTTAPEIHTTSWPGNMPWLRFSARFPQVNGKFRETGRGEMWTLPGLTTDFAQHISSPRYSNLEIESTGLFSISWIISGKRQSERRLAANMAIFMPGSSEDHLRRSQALLKGRPGISLRPFLGVLIFRVSNNMASEDDWNAVFAMIRQSRWMESSTSELAELKSTEPTIAAFLEKLFQQSFERDEWDFIPWLLDLGVPPDTRVGEDEKHLTIIAATDKRFGNRIPLSILERHELLLRHGASATLICCEDHQTAVHHAIRMGRLELVKLHDLRENWNHQDLMYEASNCSDDAAGLQMMQHLVRVHESSSRASEDVFTRARTAEVLNELTYFNCKTMLQFLSDHGVDFNCHDHSGQFPLLMAVQKDDESLCRLLLRLGALVNYNPGTHPYGSARYSVLHLVRSEEVCEALLESGADDHRPAQEISIFEESMTPLCRALQLCRYTCARILAQHDPQLENPEFLIKLRRACNTSDPSFPAVLEAIHDRQDLSPIFRQEIASMMYMHSMIRRDVERSLLRPTDHVTLLMQAIRSRRSQTVRLMLSKGWLISPPQQTRLLNEGFKTECRKMIDALLLSFPDAYSSSALRRAISLLTREASGAENQLDVLLKRRPMNSSEIQGTRSIGLAVRHATVTSDFGLLNRLDPGARTNFCLVGRNSCYPQQIPTLVLTLYHHDVITSGLELQYCDPSRNPRTLEILLGRGYKCYTFLGHMAVELGLLDHLKLLVASGYNPRRRYAWASTVLQCAVRKRNIPMMRYLLRNNADVNARPYWQLGCVSGLFGELFLVSLDKSDEPIERRRTALQTAAEFGDLEMVELLLEHDAHINASPSSVAGGTALQLACIGGFTGLAKILLSKGADPNAPKAKVDGRTALEGAAEHGRLDTVDLLLNEGCVITGSHRRQLISAVRYATKEAHMTVAKRLQDYADWTIEDEQALRCWEESDQDPVVDDSWSDESDVSDIENPSGMAMPAFARFDSSDDDTDRETWRWDYHDCTGSTCSASEYGDPADGDSEAVDLEPETSEALEIEEEGLHQSSADMIVPPHLPNTVEQSWDGEHNIVDQAFYPGSDVLPGSSWQFE